MGVAFGRPRRLEADDLPLIEDFSCGVELVDTWLRQKAPKARERRSAVVYVSVGPSGDLAGFYSLSSCSVEKEGTSGWISRYSPRQVPVILLGMLGVCERYQGAGLGADLVIDALHRSRDVSEAIGARALVVDPYNAESANFYGHLGFEHIKGPDKMFARLASLS